METPSRAQEESGRDAERLIARHVIEIGIGLSAFFVGALFGAAFFFRDLIGGEVGRGVTLVLVEAVAVSWSAWFLWEKGRGCSADGHVVLGLVLAHVVIAALVAGVFEMSPSVPLGWLCVSIAFHNVYLVLAAVETSVALSHCLSKAFAFVFMAIVIVAAKVFLYMLAIVILMMEPYLLPVVAIAGTLVLGMYRAFVVPMRTTDGTSLVHLMTNVDAWAYVLCGVGVSCGLHVRSP